MSERQKFALALKAQVVLEWLSSATSSTVLCQQPRLSGHWLAKATLLERAGLVCMSEEPRSQEVARMAE